MCGIAGIISSNPQLVTQPRLQAMTVAIKHRGPEGDGFWIEKNSHVGFGHRRLSIIDLTQGGDQPMHYLDRYTITYNGELYNYIELREDLKKQGYSFKSACDTEVVLAAYACYKEACLQYFDGMFAFAIWDQQEHTLFCARDRFGEKPFYFYKDESQFVFASEMKALWAAGIEKQMDDTMLLHYIGFGSTSHATNRFATFYTNIYKLPKAHFLKLTINNQEGLKKWSSEVSSYWDIDKETTVNINETEAIERFNGLFTTSVMRRLRSDVPLGTSLSGGLDSSTVVAAVNKLISTNNQKTFSAVFPGFEKDEAAQIDEVVSEFNISSFKVTPTAEDLVKDFDKLIYHQEEPFQSTSIYAQYKVYELAKQNAVTVLLDGQGADEILAGYHKYYHWYWQEFVAKGKWKKAAEEIKLAKELGVKAEWGVENYLAAYLPSLTAKQLEKKASKQLTGNAYINKEFIQSIEIKIEKPVVEKLNDILYADTIQQGLEDLLRYADRNSMAHSREVRLPFLNHELVQFIFSLPPKYKIKQGWTKWILRKAMDNALPNRIAWRKDKVGFEPPQKQWMQQKQMQELVHEGKRTLVNKGVLKAEVLNQPIAYRDAHDSQNYDWRYLCAARCM